MFAKLIDAILAGVATLGQVMVLPAPLASFICMTWFCLTDWAGLPRKWLFQLRALPLDGKPGADRFPQAESVARAADIPAGADDERAVGPAGGKSGVGSPGARLCLAVVHAREIVGRVMQPENRRWGSAASSKVEVCSVSPAPGELFAR